MSNVTLPQFPDIAPTDDWNSVIECINSYAEEYAAERVREALENYERTLRNGLRGLLVFDRNSVDLAITDSAAFIRALIPKQ